MAQNWEMQNAESNKFLANHKKLEDFAREWNSLFIYNIVK